jgi:hypothetical protein
MLSTNGSVYIKYAGYDSDKPLEVMATTTEQNSSFSVKFIIYITNDGTDDVFIKFSPDTTVNFIRIKSGESISDLPRSTETVYYRANSGTQSIRMLGVY